MLGSRIQMKIVSQLAEHGPTSTYDLARVLNKSDPIKAYSTAWANVRKLRNLEILQRMESESDLRGRRKFIYALTPHAGIPFLWAYYGRRLKYKKLLVLNRKIFAPTPGLEAYNSIWEIGGREFCARIARNAFDEIKEKGKLEQYSKIPQLIVDRAMGSLPASKLSALAARSTLVAYLVNRINKSTRRILDEAARLDRARIAGIRNRKSDLLLAF